MIVRYTRHQVARGALPDAEEGLRLVLLKRPSVLRATYQIRFLLGRAEDTGRQLVLRLHRDTKIAPDLAQLRRAHPKSLLIERA